jgi:hypothetical protein
MDRRRRTCIRRTLNSSGPQHELVKQFQRVHGSRRYRQAQLRTSSTPLKHDSQCKAGYEQDLSRRKTREEKVAELQKAFCSWQIRKILLAHTRYN